MAWTRPKLRAIVRPAAAAVAVGAAAVAGTFAAERAMLHAARNGVEASRDPLDPWRKHESMGLIRPEAVEAGAAAIRPDDVVFGVVSGGRARAYRLDALRDRGRHVVNDVLGDVPVTVTYCDITDCVRGYAGPAAEGARPLDVRLVGLYRGSMVIAVDGAYYDQKTNAPVPGGEVPKAGIPPYPAIEPVRTTWGEWLRDHPGTDVYDGPR